MEVNRERTNFKCNLGLTCSKYMLVVLNLLFIIVGVMIVSGGVSAKIIFGTYYNYYYYYNAMQDGFQMLSIFWIVVGLVLIVVAMFGICAAFKESTVFANLYGIAMVLVFIFQISAAIAGFTFISRSRWMVTDELKSLMRNYNYDETVRTNLDWIQLKFKCCGIDGPNDWSDFDKYKMNNNQWYTTSVEATTELLETGDDNHIFNNVYSTTTRDHFNMVHSSLTLTKVSQVNLTPASCCVRDSNYSNLQCDNHVEKGCFEPLHQIISESIMMIGSSALIVAVVQILGIVLGFMYARVIRHSKTQRNVLIWNSSQSNPHRPVYEDYTQIDNTDEVKHI